MITITAQKRSIFPSRYFRKDARTAIYRAVYGSLQTVYEINEETKQRVRKTYRDSGYTNYTTALSTYNQHRYTANLPFYKAQQIEQDIERLKRKPQGGENAS